MTGHGQRVIGVVAVIDIGDGEFDLEHCRRKSHVIVSTLVVLPVQSGRAQDKPTDVWADGVRGW